MSERPNQKKRRLNYLYERGDADGEGSLDVEDEEGVCVYVIDEEIQRGRAGSNEVKGRSRTRTDHEVVLLC